MAFDKPYLGGDREYLEMYNDITFEDGDPTGLSQYSEFQKPYGEDNDEYSLWENKWPPPTVFPRPPPIIIVDPVPDPCQDDGGKCTWAKIFGRTELQCPTASVYTSIHVWLGCEIAPGWAALSSWELTGMTDDKVVLISSNPIMATISVLEGAENQTVQLKYWGPLCSDEIDIVIECACCEPFVITGVGDTCKINPDHYWQGVITPACLNGVPTIQSSDGCDPGMFTELEVFNEGASVRVYASEDVCGSFTVTVTDEGSGECGSASFTVLVNDVGQGGTWDTIASVDPGCENANTDTAYTGTPQYTCGGDARTCSSFVCEPYSPWGCDGGPSSMIRYGTSSNCGSGITWRCAGACAGGGCETCSEMGGPGQMPPCSCYRVDAEGTCMNLNCGGYICENEPWHHLPDGCSCECPNIYGWNTCLWSCEC
jgi:hypothetical protein